VTCQLRPSPSPERGHLGARPASEVPLAIGIPKATAFIGFLSLSVWPVEGFIAAEPRPLCATRDNLTLSISHHRPVAPSVIASRRVAQRARGQPPAMAVSRRGNSRRRRGRNKRFLLMLCRVAKRRNPWVCALFRGSSAVEQPAVNRLVAGSNPARGAST
jgi:hypothetical protein